MRTSFEEALHNNAQTAYCLKWAKSKKLLDAQLLLYNAGKPLHQQLRCAHKSLAEKLLYLYSVALHYYQGYVQRLIPGATPLPSLRANNVQLAKMLNCSERSIQNLRSRLRMAGIITREVWHGTNSQYELYLSPQVIHLQLGGDPDNQVAQFFAAPTAPGSFPYPQSLHHTVSSKTNLDTNKLNKLSGADCQQVEAPKLGAEPAPNGHPLEEVEGRKKLVENLQQNDVPELFSGYETTRTGPETPPPIAVHPPEVASGTGWMEADKSLTSPRHSRSFDTSPEYPMQKSSPKIPQNTPTQPQRTTLFAEAGTGTTPLPERHRRTRRGDIATKSNTAAAPTPLALSPKLPSTLDSVYTGLSPSDRLQLDRQVSRMASVALNTLYADRWICDQEYERLRIALAEYLRYAPAAKYTRGANEVVERMHLVRRWIDSGEAQGQKRWVPLPSLYFDVRNARGFVVTKAWFKKHRQAKVAIKDREMLTKAINFYLASLGPEAVIAPLEAYRRVTQTLGKRKAELVQQFHMQIMGSNHSGSFAPIALF